MIMISFKNGTSCYIEAKYMKGMNKAIQDKVKFIALTKSVDGNEDEVETIINTEEITFAQLCATSTPQP